MCASLRIDHNYSSTDGLAVESDLSSTLEGYVGFRAGGLRWHVAVRAVHTCATTAEKMLSRKANQLEAYTSKRDREGNRATSVSEQIYLRPQNVRGWQPSCQRLPPASWDVVRLGVGMMALCCAVLCCVEYSCSGPSINIAGICRPVILRQYIGNQRSSLNTADTGCFCYLIQAVSKALWR